MGSQGQAYKVFSLFACSFIVFLELGLEEAAPHFEAELWPWPCIPDCSPDLSLIKEIHKIAHHLLEVLEGLGLDLTYLCLEDTPSLKIFQCPSPFRKANRPCQDLSTPTTSPQSG